MSVLFSIGICIQPTIKNLFYFLFLRSLQPTQEYKRASSKTLEENTNYLALNFIRHQNSMYILRIH